MKLRFFIGLSLLILLVSYGCGGSCEIERKQAQEAMGKAKESHAENYATTDFQQAQKAWDRGQAAEKEGNSSTAKVLYTSARIFSGKAADIGKAKKEALSRELISMQLVIGKNLDDMKTDLSKGGFSLRKRSEVEAIASEVEKDNASIEKMVTEEDLAKAIATAKSVQTKIYHAQLILAGQKLPE
jgi:hypothetical protein